MSGEDGRLWADFALVLLKEEGDSLRSRAPISGGGGQSGLNEQRAREKQRLSLYLSKRSIGFSL